MWNQDPYVGTSGFAYKTFVGSLYPQGLPQARWLDHYVTAFTSYSDAELERWARDAREKRQDRPVFAYFNNDAQGHAVPNARTLAAFLGSRPQRRTPEKGQA